MALRKNNELFDPSMADVYSPEEARLIIEKAERQPRERIRPLDRANIRGFVNGMIFQDLVHEAKFSGSYDDLHSILDQSIRRVTDRVMEEVSQVRRSMR